MFEYQLIYLNLEEERPWDVFNDENDVRNGYDRNSMMLAIFCIAKALGESNPSFVPVLVYLDRICVDHEDFVISEKNIRRLVIVAICVSNKMFDDFNIANWCYAELLGISNAQFNFLERVFVQLLHYDLNVCHEEYKSYSLHMREFVKETFSTQKQAASQQVTVQEERQELQVPSEMEQNEIQC